VKFDRFQTKREPHEKCKLGKGKLKRGWMKNSRIANGRKTGAAVFLSSLLFVLAGLVTFDRSRQGNRGKNFTQGGGKL
jgi:hypothetical protein